MMADRIRGAVAELWNAEQSLSFASSSTDKHGQRAVGHDAHGLTPKQETREPASAVRSHDDEIAASVLGSQQNSFGWITLQVHGRAHDIQLLRDIARRRQDLRRSVRSSLFVLVERESGRRIAGDDRRLRFRYGDGRCFGVKRLGQGQASSHDFLGQL